MRETKIIRAAKAAKADGYKYMTSVVKSVYRTEYHHVVDIDDILTAGRWIPAAKGPIGQTGAHGRHGQIHIPARSINKSTAIVRYCGQGA